MTFLKHLLEDATWWKWSASFLLGLGTGIGSEWIEAVDMLAGLVLKGFSICSLSLGMYYTWRKIRGKAVDEEQGNKR